MRTPGRIKGPNVDVEVSKTGTEWLALEPTRPQQPVTAHRHKRREHAHEQTTPSLQKLQ